MTTLTTARTRFWEGEILSLRGRKGSPSRMTKRDIPQSIRDRNRRRKNGGSVLEL